MGPNQPKKICLHDPTFLRKRTGWIWGLFVFMFGRVMVEAESPHPLR